MKPEIMYNEVTNAWHVVIGTNKYTFVTELEAQTFATQWDDPASNALTEWSMSINTLLLGAEQLMNSALSSQILYHDNNLYTSIQALPDGTYVPGTRITKEKALAAGFLMNDLIAWLSENVDATVYGTYGNRRQVITRRV